MKIVSVVFFTVALVGSWTLMRAHNPVPESMHVDVQNDLKKIIADYVQKNLPQSQNLRFDKFYTEAVKHNRMKAFFAYSFEDTTQASGPTIMHIDGTAVLDKVEEGADSVTWSLDELKISDNHVDFQEPVHITAGAASDDHEPNVQPAPQNQETK